MVSSKYGVNVLEQNKTNEDCGICNVGSAFYYTRNVVELNNKQIRGSNCNVGPT